MHSPCTRRSLGLSDLHGAPVCHSSPKIGVNTECPWTGKERWFVAVSSLRKLSSGDYRYPNRYPLSPFRDPTSLMTYRGSRPVIPVRHLAWHGTTPNRPVARWGRASGEEGWLPSQLYSRAPALPQAPAGSCIWKYHFGGPALLLRTRVVPTARSIAMGPRRHPEIRTKRHRMMRVIEHAAIRIVNAGAYDSSDTLDDLAWDK